MPKPLKPTHREKNRYIAFTIKTKPETKLQREDVIKLTNNACLRYLGELGTSKTSIWLTDWNNEKQTGILKVKHTETENVKAALTLIKEIPAKNQKENKIQTQYITLGISGTIKKTKQKYIN